LFAWRPFAGLWRHYDDEIGTEEVGASADDKFEHRHSVPLDSFLAFGSVNWREVGAKKEGVAVCRDLRGFDGVRQAIQFMLVTIRYVFGMNLVRFGRFASEPTERAEVGAKKEYIRLFFGPQTIDEDSYSES